jgi:hypothetical protein
MPSRNTIDPQDLAVQKDLDLFVLEELPNGLRDIRVLVRELSPASNQCYPASRPAYGLRHLNSDIPASQNDQVFGEALPVERLDMRQGLGILQPGDVRYGGVTSHVHKYPLAGQRSLAAIAQTDVQGARSNERTFSENQLGAGRVVLIEMNPNEIIHHIALSRINSRHVDGCRSGVNPEYFARQACHIRARAADELPLDDGVHDSSLPPAPLPNTRTSYCSTLLMSIVWIS